MPPLSPFGSTPQGLTSLVSELGLELQIQFQNWIDPNAGNMMLTQVSHLMVMQLLKESCPTIGWNFCADVMSQH